MEVWKEYDFIGHHGSVYDVKWGYQREGYFSAGGDGAIVHWDLAKPEPATRMAKIDAPIFCLCLNANLMLAGDQNGNLYAIGLKEASSELQWEQRLGRSIFSVYHNERFAWAGTANGYLAKLDLANGQVVWHKKVSEGHIRSMAWLDASGILALGSSDGFIRLANPDNGGIISHQSGHGLSAFSLAVGASGRVLFSGGRDALLKRWRVSENSTLKEELAVPAHMMALNRLALSPDGYHLASASRDKEIRIWESDTLLLRKVINHQKNSGHTHSVNGLSWPKADQLVSVGDDRRLIVWKLENQPL